MYICVYIYIYICETASDKELPRVPGGGWQGAELPNPKTLKP